MNENVRTAMYVTVTSLLYSLEISILRLVFVVCAHRGSDTSDPVSAVASVALNSLFCSGLITVYYVQTRAIRKSDHSAYPHTSALSKKVFHS